MLNFLVASQVPLIMLEAGSKLPYGEGLQFDFKNINYNKTPQNIPCSFTAKFTIKAFVEISGV